MRRELLEVGQGPCISHIWRKLWDGHWAGQTYFSDTPLQFIPPLQHQKISLFSMTRPPAPSELSSGPTFVPTVPLRLAAMVGCHEHICPAIEVAHVTKPSDIAHNSIREALKMN